MRLLLDQNLSHRLKHSLESAYPGSAHVRDFGLERADESAVWAFAKVEGFAIVSKDSDFHQRSLVFGHPPKVAWLRLGNCSTAEIADALLVSRRTFEAFLLDDGASLLTLDRTGGQPRPRRRVSRVRRLVCLIARVACRPDPVSDPVGSVRDRLSLRRAQDIWIRTEETQVLRGQRWERPLRHKPKAGVLPSHSMWSGWPNGYRTLWLDPKGWGTEKMLAFEGQFSPKPEAPQAPA